MNMAEDTSGWQLAARAADEYLNQLYDKEDLKVIFLTEWGTPNGKCHFKFPVFWNIPFCCHITDNVLNVYSLGLILLISTSSCSNYLNRIHRLKQARLFDEFS